MIGPVPAYACTWKDALEQWVNAEVESSSNKEFDNE